MFRVIDLPAEVDLSKSNATFHDGRLEVMMPKAAPAKSLRVEMKPELSAKGDTTVHGTGGIEAEDNPPRPLRRTSRTSRRRQPRPGNSSGGRKAAVKCDQ